MTHPGQVQVTWTALTGDDTRGSPISSYHLQWNKGSGTTYEDLVGFTSDYTSLTFLVTSNISAKGTYKFRVKAKNAHGWATDWSPIGSVVASSKPNQGNTVTTAVYNKTFVRISWVAPSDNSDDLSSYEVIIQQKDGTLTRDATNCPGTNAA
jgi:hypothetical protein